MLQVQNVIDMPENDNLTLLEASRYSVSLTQLNTTLLPCLNGQCDKCISCIEAEIP
jgi:hypothetical protein